MNKHPSEAERIADSLLVGLTDRVGSESAGWDKGGKRKSSRVVSLGTNKEGKNTTLNLKYMVRLHHLQKERYLIFFHAARKSCGN